MGVLKFLIIASIALFPLGEIFRIQIAQSVFIKPIDIALGIAFILWLALIVKNKKNRLETKENYLTKPILFFVTVAFLSLLINSKLLNESEFFVSLLYLIRWFVYVGIYFIVSAFDKAFKKTILNTMIIAGGIVLVLGFIQYAFYPSLKNLFYLGWDEHMYRMFGTFLDPNFLGTFLVLFFLFLVGKLFNQGEKKASHGYRILYSSIALLTLGAIFLTFSRSAVIMFIASTTILLILLEKKKWIFALLGILVIVFIASSRYFYIENINPFRIVSTKARLETTSNAIQMIKNNFFFGVGFNAYKYAQIRYGFRKEINALVSHADAGPDNSFLFVLATTGSIGFVSYLFIWYSLLRRYWKIYKSEKNIFAAVVVASITGIFLNSFFINSLFFPPLMLWMWILIGIRDYT